MVELHVPVTLPWGRSSWYPGYLGGPQSWSECCTDEKTLAPAGNRTKIILPSSLQPTDWVVNIITKIFTACIGEIFEVQQLSDDGNFMFRSVAVLFNRHLHTGHGVQTVQHISKLDWFPQLFIEHRPYIIMMENVKSVNFLKTYIKVKCERIESMLKRVLSSGI
jgi:hypothetical protein